MSDFSHQRAKHAASKPGVMTKHPIAAIQKRAIDSEAFAHLPPSAVVVLLLLARNLEMNKNGYVFLSEDDAARHGVYPKTLYRCLRVLVAAGFIYPTSRGGNGKCSTFALTWLPLAKDVRGLHVENFAPCAWRDWKPEAHDERFSVPVKKSYRIGQKRVETPASVDKNSQRQPDKFTGIEVNNTNTDTDAPDVWPAIDHRSKSKPRLPPIMRVSESAVALAAALERAGNPLLGEWIALSNDIAVVHVERVLQ